MFLMIHIYNGKEELGLVFTSMSMTHQCCFSFYLRLIFMINNKYSQNNGCNIIIIINFANPIGGCFDII